MDEAKEALRLTLDYLGAVLHGNKPPCTAIELSRKVRAALKAIAEQQQSQE